MRTLQLDRALGAQVHDSPSPDEFRRAAPDERSSSSPAGAFKSGMQVYHETLGRGVVKKSRRAEDNKVLFEWERTEKESRRGSGRRKMVTVTRNRWVEGSSLRKPSSMPQELSDAESSCSEKSNLRREGVKKAKPINERSHVQDGDVPEEIASLGQTPKLSAHEHDRILKRKRDAEARYGAAHRRTPDSKVSAQARCQEFNSPKDNSFFVSKGSIKCAACCEIKHNKWSSLTAHVQSSKHEGNLVKWLSCKQRDAVKKQDILEYFETHNGEQGTCVDIDESLYRYRTVEAFIATGVPLAKIDGLRPLLQRSGYALTDSSHLKQFIPKIEADEMHRLLQEIKGQHVSTSFDGTTRLGEAMNMVNRWCTVDFNLVQRLTMFKTVEKHMDNAQLARLIGEKLFRELHVTAGNHVAFQRDSAKVNGCAVERLSQLFDSSEDIMCICHTLCHCGEHFQLKVLDSFMQRWIGLVYSNNGARMIWKELVQAQIVGFSNVRWYCKAEIEMQLASNFPLLRQALDKFEEREIGSAHTSAMKKCFEEEGQQLELELAAMLDQRRLVSTTYELEGDGLEIIAAYDKIEALRAYGRSLGNEGTLPNADAVMKKHLKVAKGSVIRKLWPGIGMCEAKVTEIIPDLESTLHPGQVVKGYKVKYTSDGEEEDLEEEEIRRWLVINHLPQRVALITALKAGYQYLEDRMTGNCDRRYDCSHMFKVLELVRAFNPAFASCHVDAEWIDKLFVIGPLQQEDLISGLKNELTDYISAASRAVVDSSDIASLTRDVLLWWRNNGPKLPAWSKAARIVFAMSPNSAGCERVFSLLENMFTKEQKNVLADQLQASLMLKYNRREIG